MAGLRLDKIAEMVGGELKGDGSVVVESISSPEKHLGNTISPYWEKKFAGQIRPGMTLLTKRGWTPAGCSGVEVDEPRRALTSLLEYFDQERRVPVVPQVDKTAVIAADAVLGRNVYVGPGCIVCSGASVGDGCVLSGRVWVGRDVKVGAGTSIDCGVVLYDGVTVGRGCMLHANAVIGCDGFGFMPDPQKGLLRIPQIGTAVIGDHVEIGVGTTIDRATFGETTIGNCVKIDAQVKIGHNCHVGDFSIIVAQTGVAGSSTIGRGVTMASQSGMANHTTIGDGATVAARGGVIADIPAGAVVSGFPAIDHRRDLHQMAAIQQLPELVKRVRELEARIKKLEEGKAE